MPLTPKDYAAKILSTLPAKADLYSKHGATKLAALVMAAWTRRGVGNVVVTVEAIPGHAGLWGVTSNLVGGLPPVAKGRGRPAGHSNGKRVLSPGVEPEVAAARKRFLA